MVLIVTAAQSVKNSDFVYVAYHKYNTDVGLSQNFKSLAEGITEILNSKIASSIIKISSSEFKSRMISNKRVVIVGADSALISKFGLNTFEISNLNEKDDEEFIYDYLQECLVKQMKNLIQGFNFCETFVKENPKEFFEVKNNLVFNNTALKELNLTRGKKSLISKIDFTKTRCGRKKLKFEVENPPIRESFIKNRQENASKFIGSHSSLMKIRLLLSEMPEVSKLIRNLNSSFLNSKESPVESAKENIIGSGMSTSLYISNSISFVEACKNEDIIGDSLSESTSKDYSISNVIPVDKNIEEDDCILTSKNYDDLELPPECYSNDSFIKSHLDVQFVYSLASLIYSSKELISILIDIKYEPADEIGTPNPDILEYLINSNKIISEKLERLICPGLIFTLTPSIYNNLADLLLPGTDEYLDLAKEIYCKNVEALQKILLEYKGSTNFEVYYDADYGGCLKRNRQFTTENEIKNLSFSGGDSLHTVKENKQFLLYSNIHIKLLNFKVKQSFEQIIEISSKYCRIFINSYPEIQNYIFEMKNIIEELDLVQSISCYSKSTTGCIPKFNKEQKIISNSYHPNVSGAIANSFDLSKTFNIIASPNMSGKTTYVRQLGILIVMAQIGYAIPADNANIPIFQNITFISKIEDVSEILDLLSAGLTNVLVVIDELRANDAVFSVICNALCKYSSSNSNVLVYLITHRADILEILNLPINSNILCMKNFHSKKGFDSREFAIEIAAKFLPEEVIQTAKKYYCENGSSFSSKTTNNTQI